MKILPFDLRRALPRAITVLGIVAICLGATSKSCRIANEDDDDDGVFVVALHLEGDGGVIKSNFDETEDITLVLQVTNQSDSSASIQFDTGRTHDFVVLEDGEDRVIWQFSEAEPFPTNGTELEFDANETLRFEAVWDQTTRLGQQARNGTYEARGALYFRGFDSDPRADNEFGSPIVRFTIQD